MVEADDDKEDASEADSLEPPIFVSDASAEAERLTDGLRARGYRVVDVPLSLLVNRVSVQKPALILCDVDAEGALDTTAQLRDVPEANEVDIIFLGESGKTLDNMPDAVFHEGSGFFVRPVDVYALLRKVEALVGPPKGSARPSSRLSLPPSQRLSSSNPPSRSRPPPSARPSKPRVSSRPPPPSMDDDESRSSRPPATRASAPPLSQRPERSPDVRSTSSVPSDAPHDTSSPPELPPAIPLGAGEGDDRDEKQPHAVMSPQLEQLLATAEERASNAVRAAPPPSDRMSPEEEVETVLPADVLAALDEPLDDEDIDGDEGSESHGTGRGATGVGTGAGRSIGTSAGTGTGLGTGAGTGWGGGSAAGSDAGQAGDSSLGTGVGTNIVGAAPATHSGALDSGISLAMGTEAPSSEPVGVDAARLPPAPPSSTGDAAPMDAVTAAGAPIAVQQLSDSQIPPPATQWEPPGHPGPAEGPIIRESRDASTAPPKPASNEPSTRPPPGIPSVLGRGEAIRALARVIRARYSGALAFEADGGIRRVVLRDGDFVTAASSVDGESLVAFLVARGDLPADVGQALGRKIAQFGRHAGAALIAHGHLPQDALWNVLRSHAEWIIGRALNINRGAASVEKSIPARLEAEPAVFGGATGAEVFVEMVRRVIPPSEALQRLNGGSSRLQEGPTANLLSECALAPEDMNLVTTGLGGTVRELLSGASPELASTLYALWELGIVEPADKNDAHAAASVGKAEQSQPAEPLDELDAEAVRARIETRRALVADGDYFALLGVAHMATAYDIKRAYLDLRRELEPGRILTGLTADLADDLDVVLEVLDEAYEILSDQVRRERYRRAIEATP